MRLVIIALVLIASLILGIFVYRSRHSADRLQVDPTAREEIEKAKHH
jgi:hypothetical protein